MMVDGNVEGSCQYLKGIQKHCLVVLVVCHGLVEDHANHLLPVGTIQAQLQLEHVSIHHCCETWTGQKEVCILW